MNKAGQTGVGRLLWRSAITGVGYVLFVTIGGTLTRLVGLSAPILQGLSSNASRSQVLLIQFLSGVLIGLIFGTLSLKLTVSRGWRSGILFAVCFGINSVLIVVEGLFFTTTPLPGQMYNLVSSAIVWIGMSILLAVLFRPSVDELSPITAIREAVARRSWASNLWRFLLAGFSYLPIFIIFGLLSQPYVSTYYEDPAYGINQLFSVPAPEVIFPLELVRGYLFVILVYPLIVILGREMGRWRQSAWVALVIASLSGWLPMLVADFFPLPFRLAHGIELTLDAVFHSVVIVWLIGVNGAKDSQRIEGGTAA